MTTVKIDFTAEELIWMKMSFKGSLDDCVEDGSVVVKKIFDKLIEKVNKAMNDL